MPQKFFPPSLINTFLHCQTLTGQLSDAVAFVHQQEARATVLQAHTAAAWNPSLSHSSPWDKESAGNRDGIELHHIQIESLCLSHLLLPLSFSLSLSQIVRHLMNAIFTLSHLAHNRVSPKNHLAIQGKETSICSVIVTAWIFFPLSFSSDTNSAGYNIHQLCEVMVRIAGGSVENTNLLTVYQLILCF